MSKFQFIICFVISGCFIVSSVAKAQIREAPLIRGYRLLYEGKILEPEGGALHIFVGLLEDPTVGEKAREGLVRIANLAVSRTQKGRYEDGVNIIKALKRVQNSDLDAEIRDATTKVAAFLNRRGALMKEDGRCVSAKRIYEQALALNPGDKEVEKSLDQLKNAQGSLAIYCDPWGEVFIDESKTEHIAPVDGVLLLCGKYKVGIKQSNGIKAETIMKVRSGQRTRVVMTGDKLEALED